MNLAVTRNTLMTPALENVSLRLLVQVDSHVLVDL